MKKCNKCGHICPDSTKFCPSCGNLLTGVSQYYNNNTVIETNRHNSAPSYNNAYKPNGRPNNNTLVIIVCAVSFVIICALLLYIFIGRGKSSDNEDSTMAEGTRIEGEYAGNNVWTASADENPWLWLSQRSVTASDIQGKTPAEIRIMRNAIFARHGYIFQSDDLREYFSRFSWYTPQYRNVNNMFNEVERDNITYLKKHESKTTTASKPAPSRLQSVGFTDDYSDIVCYVKLTDSDVAGLSKAQIRILRNTIYARHGRKFKSADLRNYFNGFSWYHGVYDEIPPNSLSDIEKHNIALLQKYE